MKLTPTQQRMFDRLKDGTPVSRDELRKCLWDEHGTCPSTVKVAITRLRKNIRPEGMDVFTGVHKGMPHYVLVRMLNPLRQVDLDPLTAA